MYDMLHNAFPASTWKLALFVNAVDPQVQLRTNDGMEERPQSWYRKSLVS
jgi:hypothetical protein